MGKPDVWLARDRYARTAAGLSPFNDPPPGRMPPASPAIVLNRAMERVIVDNEHPSWSQMLPRVKPRAEGQPKTTATATTATRAVPGHLGDFEPRRDERWLDPHAPEGRAAEEFHGGFHPFFLDELQDQLVQMGLGDG